jgi:hypothetical protein
MFGAHDDSAVNERAQISNITEANRYPDVFGAVAAMVTAKTGAANILSFGCSDGTECRTLAEMYFTRPGDIIVGVDINTKILETAKASNSLPRIRYETSDPKTIRRLGPYDAVFAMSVLCRWPDTETMTDISEVYPFRRFQNVVRFLSSNLKRGGILAVYNSSYLVEHADLRGAIVPLHISAIASAGFVKKFGRDGREIESNYSPGVIFQRI